jgi:hypothetical protein
VGAVHSAAIPWDAQHPRASQVLHCAELDVPQWAIMRSYKALRAR